MPIMQSKNLFLSAKNRWRSLCITRYSAEW